MILAKDVFKNIYISTIIAILASTECLPNGAPCSALESMTPRHGNLTETRQKDRIPRFVLEFRTEKNLPLDCYTATMTVRVFITSAGITQRSFQGFSIQARLAGRIRRTGQFQESSEARRHCDEPGAVTHINVKSQTTGNFFVTWNSYLMERNDVHFMATIAESKTVWFENIGGNSSLLRYRESCKGKDINDAVDDIIQTNEDEAVYINVLGNDLNKKNQPKVIGITNNPTNGVAVLVNITTIKYVPSLNYFGKDSFKYQTRDNFGILHSAYVKITITPVNDQPEARNDTNTVEEGLGPIFTDVLKNDFDEEGDMFNLTGAWTWPRGSGDHSCGNVSIHGSKIKFDPKLNFIGLCHIQYEIWDGERSSRGFLLVNVTEVLNVPPEAIEDNVNVINGQLVDINVIKNDRDNDSQTLELQRIELPTGMKGNAMVLNNSSVRYTARDNFTGVVNFEYYVSDEQGHTSIGLVTITVISMLDANGCMGNGNYSSVTEGDDETETKPYVQIQNLSYAWLNNKKHCICAGCKLLIKEKSNFSSSNVTFNLENTKTAFEVTNSFVSLISSTLLLTSQNPTIENSKICILTHNNGTNQSKLSVSNSVIKLKNSQISTCSGMDVADINITNSTIDFHSTYLGVHSKFSIQGTTPAINKFKLENSVISVDDTTMGSDEPHYPKVSFLIHDNSTFKSTGASISLNMPANHNIKLKFSDMILDAGAKIIGSEGSEIRIDLQGILPRGPNDPQLRSLFHLKSGSTMLWHYGLDIQIILRRNSTLIIEREKTMTLNSSPKVVSELYLVSSFLVIATDFKIRDLVLDIFSLDCTVFRSFEADGESAEEEPKVQHFKLILGFQTFVNNNMTNNVRCVEPKQTDESI